MGMEEASLREWEEAFLWEEMEEASLWEWRKFPCPVGMEEVSLWGNGGSFPVGMEEASLWEWRKFPCGNGGSFPVGNFPVGREVFPVGRKFPVEEVSL